MELSTSNIGAVVLAAGNSSRMGFPKQLLELDGKTLLVKTCESILSAGIKKIVVVTGAYQNEISNCILNYPVEEFHNPNWETGMASSINVGVTSISNQFSELDAIIICLCDQPFLNAQHISNLIDPYQKSEKKIVTSYYNGLESVPALFTKSYFKNLLDLSGQEGARKIIRKNKSSVYKVPFPRGIYDVDTLEAWEKVKTLYKEDRY